MDVLFQRHYVSKPEHIGTLKGVIDRTIDASKRVDDMLLCMRVAYKPNIDNSTYFDLCKQMSRVKGHVFSTVVEKSTEIPGTSYNGAGTGLSSMLFNSVTFKTIDNEEPVIITMDGDQYPINDIDLLETSKDISKRLKNNKAVWGLGARTHVTLSADPEMDKIRKLHEMFQSYISCRYLNRSNPNPCGLDLSDVSPCYKELGESTPGFYAFNHGSPLAEEVKRDFSKSAEKSCFKGFAMDYYMTSLISSKKQGIEYAYVPTNPEHPNVKHSREAIERLIREQTHEVLQSNIGNFFLNEISSENVVDTLTKYFDRKDILHVQNLMTVQ